MNNGHAVAVTLQFRQEQQQTNQSHEFDNFLEYQQFQQNFPNRKQIEIKFEFVQIEPIVPWGAVCRCW